MNEKDKSIKSDGLPEIYEGKVKYEREGGVVKILEENCPLGLGIHMQFPGINREKDYRFCKNSKDGKLCYFLRDYCLKSLGRFAVDLDSEGFSSGLITCDAELYRKKGMIE